MHQPHRRARGRASRARSFALTVGLAMTASLAPAAVTPSPEVRLSAPATGAASAAPFPAPGVLLEGQSPSVAPDRRRTPDGYAYERSPARLEPRTRQARQPRPTGRLVRVDGGSAVHGSGPLARFDVRVEGGLGRAAKGFAGTVERVLFDRRGWVRSGISLQRVGSGLVDFRVILASPALTDRLCAPALTRGRFSCHNDGNVIVNFWRWTHGADAYRGDLERYRVYVVNHEVGHALGRGHLGCPGSGLKAPVMMQQTLGVATCKPNPWPLPYEVG